MNRILLARVILTGVGVVVWGYGQRVDQPQTRLAGIGILGVAFLLRFAPKRWSDTDDS